MPPTPPSPHILPPALNPLNQFAEISLATRGVAQSRNLDYITTYLRHLVANSPANTKTKTATSTTTTAPTTDLITPSNSPSPPLSSHISPGISGSSAKTSPSWRHVIVPPAAHTSSNPFGMAHRILAGNSNSNLPPQPAPEDLRVIGRRKMDFPLAAPDSTNANVTSLTSGSLGEVEDSEYPESVGGQSSYDGDRTHDAGLHECQECGKAYSTSSNLARHRQTHR